MPAKLHFSHSPGFTRDPLLELEKLEKEKKRKKNIVTVNEYFDKWSSIVRISRNIIMHTSRMSVIGEKYVHADLKKKKTPFKKKKNPTATNPCETNYIQELALTLHIRIGNT